MNKKRIGYWLPARATMMSVTYEQPGALLEEVRDGFLSRLEQRLEMVEIGDFRKGFVSCGKPVIPGADLDGLDGFVWFGDTGRDFRRECNLEILRALARQMPVLNSPQGYETAMDKFQTSRFLAEKGLPAPPTLLFTPDNVEAAAEHVREWGGPVLLKPRLGSYGVGIVKIDRPQDLANVVDYAAPSTHYIEKLIPNDPATWIGVNIIGGKHAYSYRKGPESFFDGWKVMDRQRVGGKMLPAQPNPKQLDIAIKIAELLDMSWVGVDFVTDHAGNPFVVDVNAFPGLYPEMFVQAKIDGAALMADAVFSKLGV